MEESIPDSVQSTLMDFHGAISEIEEALEPFLSRPLDDIEANAEPLMKAKLELMAIFAANSLHWMYLCTRGENPTKHPVLDELTRVKKYIDRLKELEERGKAPKLDKQVAKNIVRNALWDPNNDQRPNDKR